MYSFLPDIFRCLTTAFFGPALTQSLCSTHWYGSLYEVAQVAACAGQAAAHWGWGRAVNLPTFLEVTVEAAPQAGQEVLAQDPNSATSFNNDLEVCFFLNSTTRRCSLRKVLRTTSVSQSPGKKTHLQISPNASLIYLS